MCNVYENLKIKIFNVLNSVFFVINIKSKFNFQGVMCLFKKQYYMRFEY